MKLMTLCVGAVFAISACTGGDAATLPTTSGWVRVADNEATLAGQGSQQMLDIAVGGPGLVAVGRDETGGDVDAAVWTSRDGLTWSRVAHDEEVFGGPGQQQMRSVTAGGPGWLQSESGRRVLTLMLQFGLRQTGSPGPGFQMWSWLWAGKVTRK